MLFAAIYCFYPVVPAVCAFLHLLFVRPAPFRGVLTHESLAVVFVVVLVVVVVVGGGGVVVTAVVAVVVFGWNLTFLVRWSSSLVVVVTPLVP